MYERYFSEYWTLWGIMYVHFGGFGGLIGLFIAGLTLHFFYLIISSRLSDPKKFYFRLWFLSYVTFGILANMGFDSALVTQFNGLVQFAFYFFVLYVFRYSPDRKLATS